MAALRNNRYFFTECWIYDWLLDIVGNFLEEMHQYAPSATFEDYCITQLVGDHVEAVLAVSWCRCFSLEMEETVMEEWMAKRQQCLLNEAYLRVAFAEDVIRSVGEAWLIIDKAITLKHEFCYYKFKL